MHWTKIDASTKCSRMRSHSSCARFAPSGGLDVGEERRIKFDQLGQQVDEDLQARLGRRRSGEEVRQHKLEQARVLGDEPLVVDGGGLHPFVHARCERERVDRGGALLQPQPDQRKEQPRPPVVSRRRRGAAALVHTVRRRRRRFVGRRRGGGGGERRACRRSGGGDHRHRRHRRRDELVDVGGRFEEVLDHLEIWGGGERRGQRVGASRHGYLSGDEGDRRSPTTAAARWPPWRAARWWPRWAEAWWRPSRWAAWPTRWAAAAAAWTPRRNWPLRRALHRQRRMAGGSLDGAQPTPPPPRAPAPPPPSPPPPSPPPPPPHRRRRRGASRPWGTASAGGRPSDRCPSHRAPGGCAAAASASTTAASTCTRGTTRMADRHGLPPVETLKEVLKHIEEAQHDRGSPRGAASLHLGLRPHQRPEQIEHPGLQRRPERLLQRREVQQP